MLPTGEVAPADGSVTYETVLRPEVIVGEIPVEVLFSGLAPGFAGLYQVNVQVPAGAVPGEDVPVTISMPNGLSDTATIVVSGP